MHTTKIHFSVFSRINESTNHLIIGLAFICILALGIPNAHAHGSSVYIEEMTWTEVRDRIAAGSTIAIVPTGGTNQNGPHMITGKNNFIVHYTSGEIAKRLGNALVAPVIAYVPAGRIEPPEGHMQFPGTLSVSGQTFAALLEDAARSLKAHGFRLICFVGDNGGSQSIQQQVADRLSLDWESSGVRVIQVSDYYARNGQEKFVQSVGLKVPHPTVHAGFVDTSELMAVDTLGVRKDKLAARSEHDYKTTGAMGDSTQASSAYGRRLLSLKVGAAVKQIEDAAVGQ